MNRQLFQDTLGWGFLLTHNYYLRMAIGWTLIAVIFDYFFLVKVFKPADGYYKIDVYLYYVLTFVLPLIVGWIKKTKRINV